MDKKRNGKYYYHGHEVSSYGQEQGYVDYRTFASGFDAILCNNIIEICNKLEDYSFYDNMVNDRYYEVENPATGEWLTFDNYSDFEEWRDEQEEPEEIEEPEEHFTTDVLQWYLVPDTSWNREELEKAGEIFTCCESLDCLVWGVTHYGTSWDYVLTDVKLTDDMFYEEV